MAKIKLSVGFMDDERAVYEGDQGLKIEALGCEFRLSVGDKGLEIMGVHAKNDISARLQIMPQVANVVEVRAVGHEEGE
jgi:hypothetical protein